MRRPSFLAVLTLATCLSSVPALAGPLERARDAQARGDLRAAQIEFRNAVRDSPGSASARAALAAASLDLGDGITAEKEARAALERGWDPGAGTALLLRAYLLQGHNQELLRDFPPQATPPAVGGQVAAARALAQLASGQAEAAKQSAEDALRLAPQAPEPYLAKAAVALAAGDRAAAEAATDEALSKAPNNPEALLRKGSLQFARRQPKEAVDTFSRLISSVPGAVVARLHRAEALMLLGDDAGAKRDVDAALTTQPNSVSGYYLRAKLLAKAQDWRGVDAALERIVPMLASFPDAYLMQAVAKNALGQAAQAEDAARRYVARQPDDPRGAKLLASLELRAGHPENAAATLARLVDRGKADAESYDLLGRAYAASGKNREAAAALEKAATLAPNDSGLQARLAAARLATGDAKGASVAAQNSLRLQPAQPAVQEMLAAADFTQGDVAGASAELAKLESGSGGQSKLSEAGRLLVGTIRLVRLDYTGARSAFETVLREHPNSVAARLNLARLAEVQGEESEADRFLHEVLENSPTNPEALRQMAVIALAGGGSSPRAAAARKVLENVHAAAPREVGPALILANVLVRTGATADAIKVLNEEPFQGPGKGAVLPFARAEAYAAAGRWNDAQTAGRAALSEQPDSIPARVLLAVTTARAGDARGAEAIIAEGLRAKPGDRVLQQAALQLAQEKGGVEGALAMADQLAAQAAAAGSPSGAEAIAPMLRAEVLAASKRYEEATRAFAAAWAKAPSAELAMRWSAALNGAGKPDEAASVLRKWIEREPTDISVLSSLSTLDILSGKYADAERQLETVVAAAPNNGAALNNLAWLLDRRGASPDRARELAQRAYFVGPSADTADTLGWILTRQGNTQVALPLLRRAASARSSQQQNPTVAYHLAYALRAVGDREEALRILTPALAGDTFPERTDAERLMAELRGG